MANIQIRIDNATKTAADLLFNSLGLDTSTAVRMFISSALDHNGVPFEVRKVKTVRSSDEGKFSREYVSKLQEMRKDPDPTFMEQPEPHFTISIIKTIFTIKKLKQTPEFQVSAFLIS